MNLLFISPNSPFESIGGVERYLLNLIAYFKNKKDTKTYILLPTTDKNSKKKDGNITIFFDNSLSIYKKAKIFSKSVEKIINENQIDVICAENFHLGLPPAYSLLLNMICMQNNIPLVLRIHSFSSTELQTELINQLSWDLISCVSKSVAGDCFQKGADINKLSTDYLGVNTATFNKIDTTDDKFKKGLGLKPNNKIILTASRIIHGRKNILTEKGIINLLETFSKISPKYPDWYLLIAVGTPPDRLKDEFDSAYKMLIGYIRLHNITDKTIVKTFQLDEMPHVYNNSSIFVLPSENETFGQVFVESMACELPVIGTKVGGIPEIISDTNNGYLVPPNDSSILTQRIESLMINNELREKFIKEGLSAVEEKFTSEKQFSEFYKNLIGLVK